MRSRLIPLVLVAYGCRVPCPPATLEMAGSCVPISLDSGMDAADAPPLVCSADFADCDHQSANGCETRFGAAAGQLSNCTACGQDCGWTCTRTGCADATDIAVGENHVCARNSKGELKCWGYNGFGQLSGTPQDLFDPIPKTHLPHATNTPLFGVGANSTCWLSGQSEVSCVGRNQDGESPNRLSVTDPVTQIVGGTYHTCLRDSGLVYSSQFGVFGGGFHCWGRNDHGQLGAPPSSGPHPESVSMPSINVAKAAPGQDHTCVIATDGLAHCWGWNGRGALGRSESSGDLNVAGLGPGLVSGVADLVDIASGVNFTCAVTADGRVLCWGINRHGELGHSGNLGVDTGVWSANFVAEAPSMITKIAAGHHHACAMTAAGEVFCWGDSEFGQRGQVGGFSQTPRRIPLDGPAVQVAAGGWTTCARLSSGGLQCWGRNAYGMLGDNSGVRVSAEPVRVAPAS